MNNTFIEIAPQPGIQRDGTTIDSKQYIDGVWVRFYRNRAKKIGGYQLIELGNSEITRTLYSVNGENCIQLFVGQQSNISTFKVFLDLVTTALIDRTPLGFVVDPNNVWSLTTVSYEDVSYIIGTAPPNGSDISNTTPSLIYGGDVTSSARLTPLTNGVDDLDTNGGVFSVGNVIVVYNDKGLIYWNDGLSINGWPTENSSEFGTAKFVYGAPIRSGTTPTALLWSLDGVTSMTMTDNGIESGSVVFSFAYVSTITTILSQGCVISYDPNFYWIGINTFYMYNGAVMELENTTNKLWFFQNLNQTYKNKVTGYVNKKYGELWWLFPKGESTENNWAIIYNINTGAWYDTPLNRSCAVSSSSQMPYPIMASSYPETFNGSTSFPMWAHEVGVNRVDPVHTTAIISSFETNKVWLIDQNPEAAVLIIDTIIPDIEQTGTMWLQVSTQGYPNSTAIISDFFEIDPTTEFLTLRQKGTISSLIFTSNVLDGDYLMGKTLVKTLISDDQRMGPSVL